MSSESLAGARAESKALKYTMVSETHDWLTVGPGVAGKAVMMLLSC